MPADDMPFIMPCVMTADIFRAERIASQSNSKTYVYVKDREYGDPGSNVFLFTIGVRNSLGLFFFYSYNWCGKAGCFLFSTYWIDHHILMCLYDQQAAGIDHFRQHTENTMMGIWYSLDWCKIYYHLFKNEECNESTIYADRQYVPKGAMLHRQLCSWNNSKLLEMTSNCLWIATILNHTPCQLNGQQWLSTNGWPDGISRYRNGNISKSILEKSA